MGVASAALAAEVADLMGHAGGGLAFALTLAGSGAVDGGGVLAIE